MYLIARCHPLFELAPTAAAVGAIIGCATLVFAATVALVQTDLKRVIAYSTMSQIGYMIMGVSVGAYGAGIFHLATHAFFKALLFMGAGSVIGAMGGEQSMDRMGGFKKAMPFTYATFVIGALALAGFPLFSGFFSKDEILAYTINRGGGYVVLGRGRLPGARRSPPSTPSGWSFVCSSARRCPRRGARRRPPAPRRSLQPGHGRGRRTPRSASPAPTTTWPRRSGR
ncbi:MAG: proton-conducting transporter membrane subunit [Thermoleophilaceae bacterium]